MRSALRHAEFRRYWAGSMASYVGYWMAFFILGWLVVHLAIDDGHPERAPLYVGLMGLASAVPIISLTLVAGTIADRADLRRILIATQSALAILSLALAAFTLAGVISIAHVLVIAALTSSVQAFDQPTRQSVLLRIVSRAELMSAFGLYSTTFTVSQIIGPALAGLLMIPLGPGPVILFAAVGQTFNALAIASLPAMPPAPRDARSLLAGVGEGIRFVLARRSLRWTVLFNGAVSFLARPYHYLLPALAIGVLGFSAVELSWLVSAVGVGAVIASLVVANLDGSRHRATLVYLSSGAAGAILVAAGSVTALPAALAVSLGFGFSLIIFGSLTATAMQLEAPDGLRTRVISIYTMFLSGSIPLGQLTLGTLATSFGLRAVLMGSGTVLAAVSVYGVLRMRDLYLAPRVPPAASEAITS
jgi:MFS family permease